ncbi:MAG: T9SS type A sorting domain-containing protein, partial [Bacteroidia bacterium]
TPFADDLGVIDIVPEQPSTENSVALYPNPTKGVLYLKVKDPKSQVRIEIFTVSGNPIYESKFTGNAIIDLNRLNIQSGMYLLNTKYDEKNAVYKVIYRP